MCPVTVSLPHMCKLSGLCRFLQPPCFSLSGLCWFLQPPCFSQFLKVSIGSEPIHAGLLLQLLLPLLLPLLLILLLLLLIIIQGCSGSRRFVPVSLPVCAGFCSLRISAYPVCAGFCSFRVSAGSCRFQLDLNQFMPVCFGNKIAMRIFGLRRLRRCD